MPELPGAMFVVDPRKENIAIQEATQIRYSSMSVLLIQTVTQMN